MQPTISVQIVTYNSEKDIESCLQSVLEQSYPIQKIIVVDNNSHDDTIKKCREFQQVEIIKNVDNTGFAGAHNQVIKLATTDYVLVLNPDVKLHEKYIEIIISFMENNNSTGMATGKLFRNIDTHLLDSTGIHMKKNRRAIDRGAGEIDQGQFDHQINVFGVSGAAAIYRKKMIDDISFEEEFYDESFFAYKEDVDVSWRAQLLGWKAAFVSNAIAEHSRGWQEERKRSQIPLYIRQKSYINRYFYIFKNDKLYMFLKHFLTIVPFEIASLGYTIVKERQLLAAWLFFIQQYRSMKCKRKFIRMKTKVTNQYIYSFFKGIW